MVKKKPDLRKLFKLWRKTPRIISLLLVRIRLAWAYHAAERYSLLIWAGLVGVLGGLSSILFRFLLDLLLYAVTGREGTIISIFSVLSPWERVVIPAAGGITAGLIIQLGGRLASGQESTTDYMEAIVLGEGSLSVRSSLTKILSSMFSIASGASIGREGPMVQLSSLLASLVGRARGWSISKRRLILACGAAAGIASAYNAPIAGALFVSEIVLGSIAMETLGPLLLASVMGTQTVRFLGMGAPLYDIPVFHFSSGTELINYLALGLLAGISAPLFLRALRGSEKLFSKIPVPVFMRLGFGGLLVGVIALYYPQVCGNGYSVVSGVLQEQWIWSALAAVVVFKLLATCSSFGSGAVGGVFTPTLFMGAGLAYLFGHAHQALGLGPVPSPGAYALAGMGMFLSATTHAPLMAILMVFEMTLDYQLILPLMLGCVVAYFTAHAFDSRSIYSGSLKRKGAYMFAVQLSRLGVSDLMKTKPVHVNEKASFEDVVRLFIVNTFRYLYVTNDSGVYLGAICLDDIKENLTTTSLSDLIIASDLLVPGPPPLSVSASLEEAFEKFTLQTQKMERLPVISDEPEPRLLGTLTKTDLMLAMAEDLFSQHHHSAGDIP